MHNPFEPLAFRAAVTPDYPAFSDGQSTLSYAQLHKTVVQVSEKLAKAGIGPGHRVYLLLPENLAFITTMALFHRAAVSCLGIHGADIPEQPRFDFVISLQPEGEIARIRNIALSQEWFNEALNKPGLEPMLHYGSVDDVCRIILTSGTTGKPKAVGLTPALIEQRLYRNHLVWGSATGNDLNLMGHASIGGFMGALQTIQAGKVVLLPASADAFAKAIRTFYVTSILSSSTALFRLVNSNALSAADLNGVREIRLAGSALSPGMISRIKQVCPQARIFNVYGSTEVGAVGMVQVTRPELVWKTAVVQPGALAEVIDDQGSPVPDGTEGIVRVRSSGMVSGYMEGSSDNNEFRDGWFYPGDRGVFRDGALCLTGRESEVVNLGGVKINPVDIETVAEQMPALTDVAACQVERADNSEKLALAYTAESTIPVSEIAEFMKNRLDATLVPTEYFQLREIPQNAMGKVKRQELSRNLSAVLRGSGS